MSDHEPKNESPDSTAKRLTERLRRDFGPLVLNSLLDPLTTDLLLNPDGKLWLKRAGEPMKEIGTMDAWRATSIIRTLAGLLGKVVTDRDPILDGELPFGGERFAGQMPPVVASPSFSIRKPAITVYDLDSYVANGIMTQEQCDAIKKAVREKKNILISGGTGAGKTTLVNSVIQEIPQGDRLAIIQDTAEIQCIAPNVVMLFTSQHVDMSDLLRASLRILPDRIIVGEVRGAEALDLLDAWNTGHEGGAATIHSNNARAALPRLRSLVSRNKYAPKDIEQLIAEVVHVVVQIGKTPEGRKVREIIEVLGYENGHFQTRNI